jgi:DNA-binding transcriptional MerR regulator
MLRMSEVLRVEYTIQKLARLAGASTRTLRYYDELGILKPARINSSGYRIYGSQEVNLLQQILFYRELGLDLESIRRLVHSPTFDAQAALVDHRAQLIARRQQLDQLIANVEKTLAAAEGSLAMQDSEKFSGFKQRALDENDRKYGDEARARYGDEAYEQSRKQWMNMTEKQYAELAQVEADLFTALEAGMAEGDAAGAEAQKAAGLHRQWLAFQWGHYSPEAHAGVARMYAEDERFQAYYDRRKPGMAAFLRDAVLVYTSKL